MPILQTLQSLLKNPVVLSEVYIYYTFCVTVNCRLTFQIKNGHTSTTSILQDFCDGDAFRSSDLYSMHTKGLLYFDEVEVCNPLGSKAIIHKLGNILGHK